MQTHPFSIVLLGLLLSTPPRASQAPQVPAPTVLDALAKEALGNPRAHTLLTQLCSVAPKRLSGSKGAAAAVEWAQETMLAIGLKNVRKEPCMVPHWERGTVERLTLLNKEGEANTDLSVCALGGSPPTPPGGIEAVVLMVRSFDELTQLGEQARGQAIFFNRPMDPTLSDPFAAYSGAVDQRGGAGVAAFKAGARCAIVRSMTLAYDDNPHTGAMRYEKDACVPTVAISTFDANELEARLALNVSVHVKLELDCRWFADEPSFNVVGEIPGSELPKEIVLVGGHLDAWDLAQGAHDDGAGCVQALEVARLIKALKLQPRRTLRVVLWMNEENGGRGSAAYRDLHREELGLHVFALESDRGGFAPRGFESSSTGSSLDVLARIGEKLGAYGVGFVNHSAHVGADVGPLQALGVPCAGFVPDSARYFDVHHSALDTIASVHPRELELGALCMASMCLSVANLDKPLDRIPLPSGEKPKR